MAGTSGAGYTHFKKVSGKEGLYTGAAGSEIKVANGGVLYKGTAGAEVAVTGSEGVISIAIAQATTAAVDVYLPAPYAASLSGYAVFSVSSGTGRVVTVNDGSAGAELGTTAITGVTGTIGAVIAFTGSANVTAGQALRINLASCATAQVQVGLTLALTKV
jgi:hypothetical protein